MRQRMVARRRIESLLDADVALEDARREVDEAVLTLHDRTLMLARRKAERAEAARLLLDTVRASGHSLPADVLRDVAELLGDGASPANEALA